MKHSLDNTDLHNEEDMICSMGCHLTWPELKDIDKSVLVKEERVVRERKLDFHILPTYYMSMKNLHGYILYKLNELEQSIAMFNEVLDNDPVNLNAISNLAIVNLRIGKMTFFNGYKIKLNAIFHDAGHMTNVIYSRAYCDRAHTVRHFQQDRRDFTYMPHLCKAIETSINVDIPEKAEWLFDYSLALFRKDYQLVLANASSQQKGPAFHEAVHNFYEVTQIDNGPVLYKALSWVFIGILLRHDKTRSLRISLPDKPDIHNMTSVNCIEMGLDILPDNPIVMRRVASEFSLIERYEEAAELFKKSLAKEMSWFAFRHQGLMYLRMYECRPNGDQGLLRMAEESFKQAIAIKDVHADHSDLGYVFFLQGPTHWNKALENFSCAKLNCQNDNFDPSETHLRWARCLKACGEHEGANMHLKLAAEIKQSITDMIEKINNVQRTHGLNCGGNDCKLFRFKYCDQQRDGYVNILSEHKTPCTSKIQFVSTHAPEQYHYDFFVSFCHIDHKWAVAFVKKIEKDFNLYGCLRYRDYGLGISIPKNIIKAIETSFKSIVIISPDSLKDRWCDFETERTVYENILRSDDRKCLVPVLLRPCTLPKSLVHLGHVKCDRGQLLERDWARLGKELNQYHLKKTKSRKHEIV